MGNYRLLKRSKKSQARIGIYKTAHGAIRTPFFMPVATRGVIKQVDISQLKELGAEILLANAYHLMLRPGLTLIRKNRGLHKFMDWPGPILTDSGGFQVFSLSGTKQRGNKPLVKISDKEAEFSSYIDGAKHVLSPEKSYEIQAGLGVDIAVCLDECIALPADKKRIEASVKRTSLWAGRTKEKHLERKGEKPLLHAVIQGGLNKKLRLKSLDDLVRIGFDGYNIGGLSVGENSREMYKVLSYLAPAMPEKNPRYLMGVGYPDNIVKAVTYGVDMFDCVIPTREGRHGRLFAWGHKDLRRDGFYKTFNINNAEFSEQDKPINPFSRIESLRSYSLAYLHYLFKIKEPLGQNLATLNNLEFYLDLMDLIRKSIRSNRL